MSAVLPGSLSNTDTLLGALGIRGRVPEREHIPEKRCRARKTPRGERGLTMSHGPNTLGDQAGERSTPVRGT